MSAVEPESHRGVHHYRIPASRHHAPPSHRSSSRHSTLPSDVSDVEEDGIGMLSDIADSSSWPGVTTLIYSGRNKIDLKPQSKHIKELLRVAVEEFRGDLFFVCTFPKLSTKVTMLHQVLRRAARALDLPQEICTRLKEDPEYNEALGAVPWARVSEWRAPLKDKAFAAINTQYGSTPDALSALLHEHGYIYPGDPLKPRKNKQPYEHAAFVLLLRDFYFTKNDEDDSTEMPDSMIASVAASIHSSLKDRQNGLSSPSVFSADAVSDIYETHMLVLEGLKATHRHALKVKLYNDVMASIQPSVSAHAQANAALACINLSAIE
ncbi:hypothetical protein FIBSPDRAFT_950038 [Athelia psychrophila]|uniref:DUF6532 domain-containing protein n=1 Tax=Athelia psychrophila TaxID=1759441 RepID=A0A166P299_9AGAM|nr:hypothetical protein FIBSPDRAFT_950038 [Fibularhizoctonia sp. CBS 109695]